MSKTLYYPFIAFLVALILGLLIFSGYSSNRNNENRRLVLERIDRLADIDVKLPVLSPNNYYMMNNPDMQNNLVDGLSKLEKSSSQAKRIFDVATEQGLDSKSRSYVETFNQKFAQYKADKKEFDCMYNGYSSYGFGGMGGGPGYFDNGNSVTTLKNTIDTAKNCGLAITEGDINNLIAKYEAANKINNEISQAYNNNSTKGETYNQAFEEKMNGLQNNSSRINGEMVKSLIDYANTKYKPLRDYADFLKSGQDNL